MADLIFNRSTDNYIFTGSRLRAPPSRALRLSTASDVSGTYIDLSTNGTIDISASSGVFINGLRVVTTSNGATTALTGLQLTANLDVSGAINSDGGIRIGSGVFGGTITKSSNAYEIIIDPFGIDGSNSSTQDASGQVVIMGDLVVRGNTTTIYSTNVDISDVLLTLASGSTTALKSNNAGIQLGDGYASLLYDSSINRWKTNIGLNISGGVIYSGNVLPLNNTSRLPVTASTFAVLNVLSNPSTVTQDLLFGDVNANTWMDASGYIIYANVLSNNSYIKIEVKIAYTSSPEADQTLGFRLLRCIDATYTNFSSTPVYSDISLGTSMGVTLNGVYYGSFYDSLAPFILTNNTVCYKLQFRRDCPTNDTISTPFGIRGSNSNYISIQELYVP